MKEAKLVEHNGSPAICVDGEILPPMMATIRTNVFTDVMFDPDYFRSLGESGIRIFFLILDTDWLKPGAFEIFKKEADMLMEVCPDAYIVPRLSTHPPISWCEENPDELVKYSDGKIRPAELYTESYIATLPGMYSFGSEKWRRDAARAVEETMDKIDSLPYADRIIGYFFSAGGTSEWYYINPMHYGNKVVYSDSGGFEQTAERVSEDVVGDTSPAFKKAFSAYLKEIYGTDEALRKAWGDESVSLDEPRIPTGDERYFIYGVDYDLTHPIGLRANSPAPPTPTNGTNNGLFINMEKTRVTYDFYRALHLITADAVIHFGKLVKDKYRGKKLSGAFYGAAASTKFFDFGTVGGVSKILESPYIDFLASPSVYENRQLGGYAGQRQATDSYRVHGKMFVCEDDTRTHHENDFYRDAFELYGIEDTKNMLKREFGRNVCTDVQAWWFDQIVGGKRYKDPEIYELFKKQQEIAKDFYNGDRRACSEIAFIYDEESYAVVSNESSVQNVELLRNYETDVVGAPYARYFHTDLDLAPDYKLYVFVNCYYLTDAEREQIKRKLRKNHATALFLWASGLINPDAEKIQGAENVEDLVGMKIKEEDAVRYGKFRITGEGFTKNLDRGEIYGDFKRRMWANASSYTARVRSSKVFLTPAYTADDEGAENLGYFLDTGAPALSVKECDGYTSVYCGSKYVCADILREVARAAGCHIYEETGDVIYANRRFLTHHAASSGKKAIRLPAPKKVTDVYTGKSFGVTDVIELEVLKGDTHMFKLEEV
ncbi:MAG: hypothetical protein IKB38_07060 [Clostridia bacterium]|nr:hypothetical protein [Clostridia bacterium]